MAEDAKVQGFAPELNAIAVQYKSFGPELWRLLRRLNEQMMRLSNQSKILEAGANITLTDFPRRNTTRISADGDDLLESFLTVDAESGLINSRQAAAGPGIQLTDNGALSTLAFETVPGYVFIANKVAYITWFNNATLQPQAWGEFLTLTAGAGQTHTAPTATETAMCLYSTAGLNNIGGLNGNNQWQCDAAGPVRGLDLDVYCRMRLNHVTNVRFWFALFDGTLATLCAGDTFGANNLAGFRFSPTVAGDTTWRAITQAGGAGITNSDTGVAVSTTATQLMQISYRSSTGYITFYIDGVQVAQSTANIPLAELHFCFGARQLEADPNRKTFNMAWYYAQQRRPIP